MRPEHCLARRSDCRGPLPLNLFRLISWPGVRRHLLRWMLTASGIVLGVAVLVAIQAANTTVVRSFGQTVDRIAGPAQLQVFGASTGGLPEDILELVRQGSVVQAAAPIIEEFAAFSSHGQDRHTHQKRNDGAKGDHSERFGEHFRDVPEDDVLGREPALARFAQQ